MNLVHKIKNLANSRYRSLFFPIAVILGVILLTSLRLSGSSLALYETSSGESASSAGVIFGEPRPVRSDEWLVRTPWFLNQIQNDLPTQSTGGMGNHDLALVADIPVRSLDLLVKPHQIPSLLLGPSQSLSAEWWIWHGLMIGGMYALVLVLTQKIGVSIFVSILLVTSPSTQWWAGPGTFITLGYGTLAAAFLLRSFDHQNRRRRMILSAMAGWLAACFVCTLYVPWIITTSIVLSFLCITSILNSTVGIKDQRARFKSISLCTGVFTLTTLILVGIFISRHLDAISVINSTVYPGARTSESGGGVKVATLFGAPLDYFSWRSNGIVVNGTNQSENSSGLMFLIPIVIATTGMVILRKISIRDRRIMMLCATLCAGISLLSWALVPVPTILGRFLLLDRVPPERVLPALTFVGLIALGQYLALEIKPNTIKEKLSVVIAVSAFVAVSIIGFNSYSVENASISLRLAAGLIAFLAISVLLLLWKYQKLGIAALLLFGSIQFLGVNPIQRGISPLLHNPVSKNVEVVRRTIGDNAGWILIGGDIYVRGSIEATGVPLISGVSRYPDYESWKVLDPGLRFEDAWNRYGHIFISPGEKGSSPSITSPQGDVIQVVLDPCDGRLNKLNAEIVVTQNFEITECGKILKTFQWGNRLIRFYSLSS